MLNASPNKKSRVGVEMGKVMMTAAQKTHSGSGSSEAKPGTGGNASASAFAAAAFASTNGSTKEKIAMPGDMMRRLSIKAKTARKEVKRENNKVINPDDSRKIAWDLYVGILILYSVVIIPWRISFKVDATGGVLYFDYTVDITFGIDMVLNFLTGYHVYNADNEKRLITDKKMISRKYLTSWFLPDFFSTVPFDTIMTLAMGNGGNLRSMKLIRVVRLFRLLKLMKLMKLARKTSSFDIRDYANPAIVSLFTLMGKILFVAHLLACFWALINDCKNSRIQRLAEHEANDTERWQYIMANPDGNHSWDDAMEVRCGDTSLSSQYLASFYWTIATMMAVGYGEIAANDAKERVYAIITQIIGATCFGFIIATVTVIVETMDPQATAKKHYMDEIREYMGEQSLGPHLRKRILRHYHYFYTRVSVFRSLNILRDLPASLQTELMHSTQSNLLGKLTLLRSLDDIFVAELIPQLKPMKLPLKDRIEHDPVISCAVYFLVKGEIHAWVDSNPESLFESSIKGGRRGSEASSPRLNKPVLHGVYHSGSDFELSPVVQLHGMRAEYHAEAVTDLMWVEQADLMEILSKYVDVEESLRHLMLEQDAQWQLVVESNTVHMHGFEAKTMILSDNVAVHLESLRDQLHTTNDTGADDDVVALARFRSRRTIGAGSTANRNPEQPALAPGERTTVEEAEETELDLWRRGIVYHGRSDKMKWDLTIGVLVVASIFIVPYRLGFNQPATGVWEVVDWLTDCLFAIDIFVNFRTSFEDDFLTTVTVPSHISTNYLTGWFAVDFFSTLPFDKLLDLAYDIDPNKLRTIKLVRILRLARLFKLVRLMSNASSPDSDFDLQILAGAGGACLKLMAVLFFIAHLFGCGWAMVAAESGNYGTWWEEDGLAPDAIAERYVASIYWAFTTMTTVGYGDILPTNDRERLYATIIMFLGATVFGYIVGSVSSLAGNTNSAAGRESEMMLRIIYYLDDNNVNKQLRRAVKQAAQYILTRRSAFDEQSILLHLPIDMRRDAIIMSQSDLLRKFDLLAAYDRKLLAHILTIMCPIFCAAGGNVYRPKDGSDGIYFVLIGRACEYSSVRVSQKEGTPEEEATYEEHVLKLIEPGGLFGHETFLLGSNRASSPENKKKQRRASPTGQFKHAAGEVGSSDAVARRGVRAETDCSLYVLGYREMQNVETRHPGLAESIEHALKRSLGNLAAKKFRAPPVHRPSVTSVALEALRDQRERTAAVAAATGDADADAEVDGAPLLALPKARGGNASVSSVSIDDGPEAKRGEAGPGALAERGSFGELDEAAGGSGTEHGSFGELEAPPSPSQRRYREQAAAAAVPALAPPSATANGRR